MIFYTVQDVAEMLKVTSPTVYRWIRDGVGGRKLKSCRAGEPRVEEQDLRDFLGLKREVKTHAPVNSGYREPTQEEIDEVMRLHGSKRSR